MPKSNNFQQKLATQVLNNTGFKKSAISFLMNNINAVHSKCMAGGFCGKDASRLLCSNEGKRGGTL